MPLLLLLACQGSSEKAAHASAKVAESSRIAPAYSADSMRAARLAAQRYVIDTMAILTKKRLPALLEKLQRTKLRTYTSAQALPPVVAAFLALKTGANGPPEIADRGAPFEATDVVYDNSLPIRQLIYLGQGDDMVLLAYYQGGFGLSVHVAIFQLRHNKIQDMWSGCLTGDPTAKEDLIQQLHELPLERTITGCGLCF
ncbi:hypothetical protein [Hymenobacter guriensis]|uniref:DUF4252 domain-containing protein n=1 Tax=Hymenobacter guriensis TaxID=2793065 RepID=A0ABS0KVU6_9BACT|nr:hypothetical protein [Hymenobacter guriensis]MBG8551992.1 hypothetical protein [Hymenobacter guriensis]